MELPHPDDREPTLAAHDLHNETGRPWSREYRLIANTGASSGSSPRSDVYRGDGADV
jgi:hypothetical protein